MNINILENGVNTFKGKIAIRSDVKNYIEFCSTLVLKQLVKVLTRIKSNTCTLIDHILRRSSEKVVQAGIIETSLSDHQLIIWTRKFKKAKPKKRNSFEVHSNFSTKIYEEALGKLIFPDYEHFNIAYSDLTSKIFDIVNKVAPAKNIRVKNNINQLFDRETAGKIKRPKKTVYKIQKT